ncbi:circularly permuted type 2 ATP-grasp protein [Neptuniibacter halophilus]|uniref:circularly permuted type 2 ATP-grasp protein n=1 Tax=Neptuniibacter halophilus TaxID=651666 RepID=UPI002573D8E0|nr:circularly permuted type 2 ATP-grasp protein [Neptuniibacter halophilus]
MNPEQSLKAPTENLIEWQDLPAGHFNEAFTASGEARPHWQYLLDGYAALGQQGIQDRAGKAARILRDDGATYNIHSAHVSEHRWELDPIPMLFSSEEWSHIETGLIERSEVLDLFLKDIYGPQELLRQGIIPPELIFSHPCFLRPCHGQALSTNQLLTLHGIDMVRGPEGEIRIIGDRTQAPSGSGYALENRTVMSRVMPSLFRDSQVHRLSLFFQTLRNTLTREAQKLSPYPNIVILTPGSYSETYFEHAYLANYLGFPLVQGSDLQVKQGKVWLKSLNGLSRVDLILRRVDDSYCDPVELRPDSFLGIAGLMEVVRAGNVIVSNPLGSGILESPALLKYLPAISEFFLGRALSLQSVKTWWGGDPQDLAYMKKHLGQLIIKPVARSQAEASIYGHLLNKTQREQVWQKIQARPLHYVAQEYLLPSYLPAWQKGVISPRPAIFRSFTVADQSGFSCMPGGLTRIGLSENETVVTNQAGSISKDTWIIASEPEKQLSLLEQKADLPESRFEAELPGRVVEDLFWMGRYAERAESGLRQIRTLFIQINGVENLSPSCKALLFAAQHPPISSEQELAARLLDKDNPESVKASILAFLINSEKVKERLSADSNRVINDLRDYLYDLERAFISGIPSAPEESLDPLVTALLAYTGVSHDSMLRGAGWRFQEMGRRCERILQTTHLIDSLLSTPLPYYAQGQALESVLLSAESMISFKRRYRGNNRVANALELLLLEPSNPRALIYQLNQLQQQFEQLPAKGAQSVSLSLGKKLLLQSIHLIQLADLKQLAESDPEGISRPYLRQLMHSLNAQIEQFCDLLTVQYFDRQTSLQQLTSNKSSRR